MDVFPILQHLICNNNDENNSVDKTKKEIK